jgi:hypothetical protein
MAPWGAHLPVRAEVHSVLHWLLYGGTWLLDGGWRLRVNFWCNELGLGWNYFYWPVVDGWDSGLPPLLGYRKLRRILIESFGHLFGFLPSARVLGWWLRAISDKVINLKIRFILFSRRVLSCMNYFSGSCQIVINFSCRRFWAASILSHHDRLRI